MSKAVESGFARNVVNFEKLVTYCISYGSKYNPASEQLSVVRLNKLLQDAQLEMLGEKASKSMFDIATNARANEFKGLKLLSSQVLNIFIISGSDKLAIDDVKGFNRKIQGRSASRHKAPPVTLSQEEALVPARTISTSQLSYDFQIDHFTKLIQAVSRDPHYAPNEAHLSVIELEAKLQALKHANTQLIDAHTNLVIARNKRAFVFFDPITGIAQTSSNVKRYIKTLFGNNSVQASEMTALTFTRR